MSVYTKVNRDELIALLETYSVGELVDFRGISAGIENTNYFVTTTGGEWVLTLFETLDYHELPYCLNLMDHFAAEGLPTPAPVADERGRFLTHFKDRPTALVKKLDGHSSEQPNTVQCAAMGEVMAQMHIAGKSYPGFRSNTRGPHWWRRASRRLMPELADEDAELLRGELRYQARFRRLDLPRGVIHGDLFRDNVLFQGDELSGLIDFYYACNDVLLYDLAVAVNDWCTLEDGRIDEDSQAVVLDAYSALRPFEPDEADAWRVMLRAAALRFWLSRLYDQHFPRPGEITHIKDPGVFARILRQRIANDCPFTGRLAT